VQIMRDMWTTGSATLDGKHYQVDGARGGPRPLQGTSLPGSDRNGIPMWIAGGGEKVTLEIAARYADYTNFDGTPDVFERKSEILREHCGAVGRDFDTIVRSANYNVLIGETEAEIDDRLALYGELLRQAGVPDGKVDANKANLRSQPAVGTPEQIVELFHAMEKQGLAYAITYFPAVGHDRSGLELFERTVIPELRD
jgi:alkanesulfonate monooxygenase SsuD/methylene tetrahydromethanopterin reductase-like flavin-dependent oxidoreductase (luciferase family)